MSYLGKRWKYYFLCMTMLLFFNFYFLLLIRERHVKYLLYLDLLLTVFLLIFSGCDYWAFRRAKAEKERLLKLDDVIYEMLSGFENKDIAEHDVRVLQEKVQEQFNENCELQDYVAKWCHEFKIPLSASLLIEERIEDAELKRAMREQLERMNQQINSMMLGCKLQSPLFDLQIKKASLTECVRTSIKNNQFFLIRKKFRLDIRVEDLYVYSDPAWLVYILDQLLNNALKYSGEEPELCIWTEEKERSVWLFVEDHGEGIRDSDIRRIFEKGFTGSNYHNGKYKSTGMGLYMAAKIIGRLGHEIHVESEYGRYTRFSIAFRDNDYFRVQGHSLQ